jgi:phosphatidylglycerol lysyltransferase
VALAFAAAAALTAWSLAHQFAGVALADVRAAIGAQPGSRLAAALALTALSFLALASYDWLAARIVAPSGVPAAAALLAGATANAVSNTLGFHAVTGSLVRARIYLRCGLDGAETARIVSLSWLALGLGFVTMLAGAELLQGLAGRRTPEALAIGACLGVLLLLLLAWLGHAPRRIRLLRFQLPLPPARLAAAQMAIGAVESAAAIGALYVLLPPDLAPSFSWFAVGCIAAVALGLVAHAPGGIGVFEASVTALLAGAGRADLLAALLLYRAIYNLLPFALSVATLAWLARRRSTPLSSTAGSVR